MADFVNWTMSLQIPIIYLTICITIPSMALYIAQIVTIVRHKQFHNSFFALFVMRAITDLLGVLGNFYGYRLPCIIGAVLYQIYSQFPNWMLAIPLFLSGHTFQANNLVTILILLNRLTAIAMPTKHEKMWRKLLPFLTIFVYCMPILTCWPVFKMNAIILMAAPNSTIDGNFAISEAGDAPYIHYNTYISTVFSVIFMILCVLINIATFVAYKLHMIKADINGNTFDDIERKLLIYALATFLGHLLFASIFLIAIFINMIDPTIMVVVLVYYPLVMDTGTVVLSSWLLLWASGNFRQQLAKDFGIIRINKAQTIRVGAQEGARNRPNSGDACAYLRQSRAQIRHSEHFLVLKLLVPRDAVSHQISSEKQELAETMPGATAPTME
uniref:Serpentine receptor class gamma n=1 Tax=Globodera rostochiensis TaxID=31243 RepID=A0A914HTF8_GLORO